MLGRTGRWVREQLFFLLVLAGLITAFVYLLAEPRHGVRGTLAISLVTIVAGLLRLTLPSAYVGMLAVRGRWIDSGFSLVLGLLIFVVDIRLRQVR